MRLRDTQVLHEMSDFRQVGPLVSRQRQTLEDIGRSMTADISRLSFEDALSELERIVRDLEGGQMKLEDAISSYEQGAALRQHCEAKLGEADMRVRAIMERADGTAASETLEDAGR
jgi:exodeoxyribonuclease VII small subunit